MSRSLWPVPSFDSRSNDGCAGRATFPEIQGSEAEQERTATLALLLGTTEEMGQSRRFGDCRAIGPLTLQPQTCCLAVDIFAPGVIQAPKLELRNMRYELSDFEWSVIKPMLPNKPRGMPRVDDRRVLNGIFWVLRSGAPWRDLPGIYGPCTTC